MPRRLSNHNFRSIPNRPLPPYEAPVWPKPEPPITEDRPVVLAKCEPVKQIRRAVAQVENGHVTCPACNVGYELLILGISPRTTATVVCTCGTSFEVPA